MMALNDERSSKHAVTFRKLISKKGRNKVLIRHIAAMKNQEVFFYQNGQKCVFQHAILLKKLWPIVPNLHKFALNENIWLMLGQF